MTRKQFVTIIDTIINRLEKGENLYTCNEIDELCLGIYFSQSDMRVAYENLIGEHAGYIPVGFHSNSDYFEPYNSAKAARRVTALSLFKESTLQSGDYKGFEYETK